MLTSTVFNTVVDLLSRVLKTLYIATHASEIVGMPKEEGLKILTELIEHCTQPKYTIAVKWHQPGDLVFWGKQRFLLYAREGQLTMYCIDNRQSMHRATQFHDQMEVRDMRRTTVFDDGPYKDGVPEAA